ncbi:DUF6704 family protein [Agrococcus casei]|uniref:Uncharacterized protein n=1 Tax=Agrococcus casei LMG 22410 TaxID=1255656 RepID=A0A1R4FR34_9MICO|nr:hypothetical protein CZ674_06005 [Agrococcus casei LMG 22410]
MSEQLVEQESAGEEFLAEIPAEHIDPGHGNSVAAWATVLIMLVAITAGCVFFWLDMVLLVWVCAGVVVLGALVGWLLNKMGFGAKSSAHGK